MKQVFLIPMSSIEKTTEDKINEAIYKIGKNSDVTWLTDLIKPLDDSKYMLVGEVEETTGTETPDIGVKVIRGSQDITKTEQIINDTLLEMDKDKDKTFIAISHPSEFMYIILYECKAGKNPRVKIVSDPADPYIGSRRLSTMLHKLDEDESWGLQPYDSFMIDEKNLIILFSEE